MEQLRGSSTETVLSLRENLLLRQKTFRLIAADAAGALTDFIVSFSTGDERLLKTVAEKAELRKQANTVNMGRYILDKEIGSENFRRSIEERFVDELLGCSI